MSNYEDICEYRGRAKEGYGCTLLTGLRFCAKHTAGLLGGVANDCTTLPIEGLTDNSSVLPSPSPTPTPTPSPVFSVQPSIAGTPQVGGSSVATPGIASNTTSHTYRWLLSTTSGGAYAAIVGATAISYIPISTDETKYLKFEDTATGPGGSTVVLSAFAGPVAAAAAIAAPVLTNPDSGWTTGDNPAKWKSTYTGLFGYNSFDGTGDQVRAHYKLGAGAWTATAWEPLDTELTDGIAVPWPFLTDGTLNAGGVFQVWEEIVRDLGLGTEQFSAASNIWTDTLTPVAIAVTATLLRQETIDLVFGDTGGSPATAITCLAGDKIVIHSTCKFNGGALTAITANAGAIAFTLIGDSGAGNDRSYAYYADTVGVTSLALTVTRSGINASSLSLHVVAIRGAAVGAPAASYFELRSVTNQDPHDVDGGLNAAASGILLVMVGTDGSAAISYTGATALGAALTGGSGGHPSRIASSNATGGNITCPGNDSGGFGFGQIVIANTKWNAA